MAKKFSSAVIGGFVISAIALLIGGVLLFGSGNFFKKKERFILFFDEVVTGLSVGAPVKFRGVEIGSVESIVLLADPETLQINIPIIIEVDPTKFRVEKKSKEKMANKLDPLIEQGLRARLDLQSIVTSQLFIQVDFFPDTPARLSGAQSEYPEIPTVKSSWGKLTEIIEEIPLKQTLHNINEVAEKIKDILATGDIEEIINHLDATIVSTKQLSVDADKMILNLDSEIQAVSAEMKKAVPELIAVFDKVASQFERIAGKTGDLLVRLDGEVEPISTSLQATLASARETLEQADSTLVTMDRFVEKSDTRIKLNKVLDRIAAAARSLDTLTDYLERHPEALLQGKKNQ